MASRKSKRAKGTSAPRARRTANNTADADGDVAKLYRLLVETVADYAIFLLDSGGHIRSWNRGAERLKGYCADEIIGKHFSVFYPAEDIRAEKPRLELETATQLGRLEDEGWRLRKDGSLFWANVIITALRGDDDSVIGFAKITRDLTARREAEEQARQLAAEGAARKEADRRSTELALLTEQLQNQALELESQTEEAQSLAEEAEQTNEQLLAALADAESAREAATNAERFIHGIVSSITDPLIVQDAEWRVRYLNPAAIALLERRRERRPETSIGKPTLDVYPRLRGSAFEEAMRRAAIERRAVTYEAFVPWRAEWWAMSCYPLPDGGLASQWKDVTERKRAEEASRYLAKASEILASSLDYEVTLHEVAALIVPELADWCTVDLVVEDGSTRQLAVAHVDPAKARWARELNERYPPQADAPTGVANVLRTGRPELYESIPEELLAAGAADDEHLRIIRELGLRSAMIVPLRVRDRILGALTLVSAESGRRYSTADLDLAMELARRTALAVENARLHRAAIEANEAKVRFLAVMSHELRTPLNAIAGYAELLRMGLRGAVTAEQIEDLDRITRNERTLLGLINDILNYARLEAGQVLYATERVRVRDVISDLEALVLPQLQAKRLHFGVGACDPDLAVQADTDKVRQILVNLLSNAIKFTPADGSIAIECQAHEASVRILVRDTGLGIPAEKLNAIFEPFVQLDRNLTSVQEGAGLGLAISRDLARGMGGELSAVSTHGRGSTFILSLRRAD